MAAPTILSARFSCPNCGQAGMFWNGDSSPVPQISNGFHFESGREGPDALPLAICDLCDEIMPLRPEG
jgi:hypothetical protein